MARSAGIAGASQATLQVLPAACRHDGFPAAARRRSADATARARRNASRMITTHTTTATRRQVHVGQAMHVGLVSCAVETPLRSVARILSAHRVHCVVVFDHGAEPDEARLLWGIVSDRDVAAAVAAGAV